MELRLRHAVWKKLQFVKYQRRALIQHHRIILFLNLSLVLLAIRTPPAKPGKSCIVVA